MRICKVLIVFLLVGWSLLACTSPKPSTPTGAPINIPVIGDSSAVDAYPEPGIPIDQSGAGAYPMPSLKTPGTDAEPVSPYPLPGGPMPVSGYEPAAEDRNLSRGEAFIDLEDSDLILMESYPLQVNLILRGDLPTSCHRLRVVVAPPDAERRIQVEVYSVVDPQLICTQALQPFEATIPLGSFSGAKYSVYVNGALLGEFDS